MTISDLIEKLQEVEDTIGNQTLYISGEGGISQGCTMLPLGTISLTPFYHGAKNKDGTYDLVDAIGEHAFPKDISGYSIDIAPLVEYS